MTLGSGHLPKLPGPSLIPIPGPSPPPPPDPEHLRLWSGPASGSASSGPTSADAAGPSSAASALEAVLEEFTRRWGRNESPRAEDFLGRLPPDDPDATLELIYHEFCLRASSGHRPSPDDLVRRFPAFRDRLLRLIALHDALPSMGGDAAGGPPLPEPGDVIGPYHLRRELGRGGFARVFLAADAELEDRLLVLKVTDRPSAEHRYLARAPHPHIVPILRERTTEDGLQLIFMPFVGGNTLAEVLAECRLRSRRPERGVDLLTALDLRSASEYAAASPGRPAREILATISYPQAVAWLVARLAEGLDHAYRRDVTHGDLKPSNILIGGDGQPMLLDFNLSTDWRPATPSTTSGDPGGTLAYMAPERLRALAEPELATPPSAVARHRADLYALGLILREALTGAPPHVPSPSSGPRSARALAAQLADERSSSTSDPSSRRLLSSIPPGLRVILRRCLSPDPADRYAHASHLAADLDRWRAGLPLVYATPPSWVTVAGWVRRRRTPLLASALCLGIGTACSSAAARVQDALVGRDERISALRARSEGQQDAMALQALDTLERLWRDPESGAYGRWEFNKFHARRTLAPPVHADRILRTYGFLGDRAGDDPWERPDIRGLVEPESSDFAAWIGEQAIRFAIATLGPEYDDFPEDRRGALHALDRVSARYSAEPIAFVSGLLRERLGIEATGSLPATSAPAWFRSYIDGVFAEAVGPGEADALGIDADRVGQERALAHYAEVLKARPKSYWAQYRAASLQAKFGDFEGAEIHLQACIDRRPECAPLWHAKAGTRFQVGAFDDAIEASQKAIRLAPRYQDAYRSLAIIGSTVGEPALVDPVLARHRQLSRSPGTGAWKQLQLEVALTSAIVGRVPPGDGTSMASQLADGLARDEDDIDLRFALANALLDLGQLDEASSQYTRVLDDDPGHLGARFNRAIVSQRTARIDAAMDDYAAIARDPDVGRLIAYVPDALLTYVILSADRIQRGRPEEAIRLAEQALALADEVGRYRGEARYALARAHASAAPGDPSHLRRAAEYLKAARDIHRDFIDVRLASDPLLRDRLAELVELIGGVAF